MKLIFALLITLLLSMGCATTYDAQRTDSEGNSTSLHVKSYREFPGGIELEYNREKGEFTLKAGEVTNGGQVEAMRDVVLGVLPLIPMPPPDG